MENKILTLLNTSVLTAYRIFEFKPVMLAEARETVRPAGEKRPAIGTRRLRRFCPQHSITTVKTNRVEFYQTTYAVALIFRLKSEGKDLNIEEIENIGYGFEILRKL